MAEAFRGRRRLLGVYGVCRSESEQALPGRAGTARPPDRDIPAKERRQGTDYYRLCHDCETLNDRSR
jgi:hypothetical protein